MMAVSSRQISHHTISGNISNSSEAEKVAAKIAACKFWDKTFSGCLPPEQQPTFWGIQSCLTINKKDDDGGAILKYAQ